MFTYHIQNQGARANLFIDHSQIVVADDPRVHVANAYHCVAVDGFERKAVI